MGAAFGAGASGTVFGAGGGGSFFTRATAILAMLFFANSILLSSPLVRNMHSAPVSVTGSIPAPAPEPALDGDVPGMPGAGEVLDLDAVTVPPADLPEVPATAPKAESDLPE